MHCSCFFDKVIVEVEVQEGSWSSYLFGIVIVASEKFPDGLETFQMGSKLFRWYGNFLDGLETFQVVRTLFR